MTLKPQLLHDSRCLLGEGPVWDHRSQKLYWVDIESFDVHVIDPNGSEHGVINVGEYVGSLCVRGSGGLILALKSGFAALDPETGEVTPLADVESHLPGNRFNDGKCDPAGRFWAGTLALDEDHGEGKGNLYCLHADHRVELKAHGVWISNGLAWTRDQKTMYYIDSPHRTVRAYAYDVSTSEIADQGVAILVPEGMGYPDGMAIDSEDMLWIAHWDGSCVRRWNPRTAEVLATIEMPVARPTSCAFGGKDFDTLYITSASTRLSPEQLAAQPLAGGLFQCKPGVRGMPMTEFAG
ncbi:MAG: SMP-30/gluconolactonase/LRE family protein [Acidobacteria bacterium]|nr:SMP-30/gluconolactonase/LRE family protein [Acidobacteriota bacterium]